MHQRKRQFNYAQRAPAKARAKQRILQDLLSEGGLMGVFLEFRV